MSKDYANHIKLNSFFLNEYKLRHIAVTESPKEFMEHMCALSSFLETYDKLNLSNNKKIIKAIDLLLDFLAFDDFEEGRMDKSQEEWATSVFKKIHQVMRKDNGDIIRKLEQKIFDWFLLIAGQIKEKELPLYSLYPSLSYFYKLSVKYGVYATHVSLLKGKKYPVGRDYSEKELVTSLEPDFWNIKNEPQDRKPYLFLCPHEVHSVCDIIPYNDDDDHLFKGKYAFLVDIKSKSIDISTVCEEIPQRIISALIQHKLANSKSITENDWELYNKYYPTISKNVFATGSATNRLLGLKIWDMTNFKQMKFPQIYKELTSKSEIYGYKKGCKGDDPKVPNISCKHCPSKEACSKQLRDNYDVAHASVVLNRIVKPSERKEIKKIKK